MVGARPGTSLEEGIASLTAGPGSLGPACTAPPAMIESLRSQLSAYGVPGSQIHAEEFSFARIGRTAAAPDDVPPSALAADRKRLASLAAVAFAGPALAITVVIGSYLVGGR